MKIKIFNLIRTQLHNDTSVWSFPTFAQAQDKMFEEASKEMDIEKSMLNIENEHCVFNSYDVWKGEDYITISDGNKVEYEIKLTTMDMIEIQEETITDEVIVMYPACKKYRSVIIETIKSFGVNELPFFNTKDIRYFIDNEVEEALAKRAAQIIVKDYDNDFQDKYLQVVEDYLEGNRGLSVMLAVINGEEDAIEDVKREINKGCGKAVFNLDYVWLWKSKWMSGKHFINREETRIFKNHDAACMEMQQKQAEVIKKFRQYYNSAKQFEDGNLFQVCDEDTYDVWEGKIVKMYIED